MPGLDIIFMGTPDFAVPSLEALIKSPHNVVAVYTQPPRPKGRGNKVVPSPVDHVASTHQIPVFTPISLKKSEEARNRFRMLAPDLAIVAAYGLLLPQEVLDIPAYGCLNVHASLLPRWRGASPIQHAIWYGDEETGISIMKMTAGLDEGPYIAQKSTPIGADDTAESIHDKLSKIGAEMTLDVVGKIAAGEALKLTPQDEEQVTYAKMLSREDGQIDWTQDASRIDCQSRAFTPWPGVWTKTADGQRLKILSVTPVTDRRHNEAQAGTLIDRDGHVACGQGSVLRINTIQPENGKRMDVSAAVNGNYLKVSDVFLMPV